MSHFCVVTYSKALDPIISEANIPEYAVPVRAIFRPKAVDTSRSAESG